MRTTLRTTLRSRTLLGLGLLAGITLLLAFRRYSGLPTWPRNGAGQNYVANLHPTSFPLNSGFYQESTRATFDWVATGGTSFVDGATNIALSSNNHADGVNSWEFAGIGTGVLGVTYVRWTGSTMTDCDIQFSNAVTWATGQSDPNDSSLPDFDFRGVARHECGHAIGFDHENVLLDNMNSIYTIGGFVPHAVGNSISGRVYGQLPHADDKFGVRIAYPPGAPTVRTNLMCTSWREPAPGQGQARKLSLAGSTYAAGAPIRVPVLVENQSNVTINGGPGGLHVGIYLSTDRFIQAAVDRGLAGYEFGGNFGPHATGYYEFDTSLPVDVPAGSYYVGVLIDDVGAIAETSESDNVAWYGPITVTNLPDLVIDSIAPATTTPVRGSTLAMNITVRNAGFAPAVATAVHLYLQPVSGPFDASYHLLGAPNFPALAAQQSVTLPYSTVIPADVCGGWWFTLHGEVDLGAWNHESNRNNNSFETPIQPQWPAAAGFYTGSQEPYLDGFNGGVGGGVRRLCTRAQGINVAPTTWYLMLMTCSGTAPGIPMPPLGTLPLNYDACTGLGLQLEGVYFTGSRGTLATTPAGSIMGIQSGTWLVPVRGLPLDFAAIYFDLATQQVVGVSRNATRLVVR